MINNKLIIKKKKNEKRIENMNKKKTQKWVIYITLTHLHYSLSNSFDGNESCNGDRHAESAKNCKVLKT